MPAKTYVGQTILLDGKCFKDATFESCTFIYKGIEGVALSGCRFVNPTFLLEGPAANTLSFLRGMYLDGFSDIFSSSAVNEIGGPNPTRH